jgi:hypothetical protein
MSYVYTSHGSWAAEYRSELGKVCGSVFRKSCNAHAKSTISHLLVTNKSFYVAGTKIVQKIVHFRAVHQQMVQMDHRSLPSELLLRPPKQIPVCIRVIANSLVFIDLVDSLNISWVQRRQLVVIKQSIKSYSKGNRKRNIHPNSVSASLGLCWTCKGYLHGQYAKRSSLALQSLCIFLQVHEVRDPHVQVPILLDSEKSAF